MSEVGWSGSSGSGRSSGGILIIVVVTTFMNTDVCRVREGETSKITDRFGLGGREEEGLATSRHCRRVVEETSRGRKGVFRVGGFG